MVVYGVRSRLLQIQSQITLVFCLSSAYAPYLVIMEWKYIILTGKHTILKGGGFQTIHLKADAHNNTA